MQSSTYEVAEMKNGVKIPDVTLDDGSSWIHSCLNQGQTGTCTSHAITACLIYINKKSQILPHYLHKFTQYHNNETQDYSKGISVKDGMKFAKSFGVPCIPKGMTMKPGSGLSFPSGTTKYAFEEIADVKQASWIKAHGIVERIKEVIRVYSLPVVTGSWSKTKTMRMNELFGILRLQYREELNFHSLEPEEETKAHALVFWGYDDTKQVFYIKNSWGDSAWALKHPGVQMKGGNATLSYSFVLDWTFDAYVGWGAKNIEHDYSTTVSSTSKNQVYQIGQVCTVPIDVAKSLSTTVSSNSRNRIIGHVCTIPSNLAKIFK